MIIFAESRPIKTIVYTSFALVAFAANSLLNRMAFAEDSIDAASFSIIRLASGAAVLLLIVKFSRRQSPLKSGGNWLSAAMLFLYTATFSFAYVTLSVGTGALILFAAVQLTMILTALWQGEHLRILGWLGLSLAFLGLTYLVIPGLSSPTLMGFMLMATAGFAWGVYTLRGRGTRNPLADTAGNFIRALPFAAGLGLFALQGGQVSATGIWLAVLSGAFASGVGYTVWYAALKGLTTTQAASIQLMVPVLASLAGIVFLSEALTLRLALSTVMILGGVGLAVAGHMDGSRSR